MGKEFDLTQEEYEKQLMRGVSLSGQNRDYFIRWRIKITKSLLMKNPKKILDFGCGEGASFPSLKEAFPEAWVEGFEPSQQLVSAAKALHGRKGGFMSKIEEMKTDYYDLVYTNGVFHHIKPKDRPKILMQIQKALKPRGIFAFWENNPWHIGTRIVMSRIPFDREAQTISPNCGKELLKKQGFKLVKKISAFHIPFLEKLPFSIYKKLINNTLGAQYLLLCSK